MYLFFNEGAQASTHTVTLMSKGKIVEVWDPQTATVTPLQFTRTGENRSVQLKLAAYESRVIVVR